MHRVARDEDITSDPAGKLRINYDLHKRPYFGVAYTPQKIIDNPLESTRTSVDFGLFAYHHLSDGDTRSPTMHRLRLFEGQSICSRSRPSSCSR